MREGADEHQRPFRVAMTCAAFEPGFRGGGPIRSAVRIVDTLPSGVELSLMTRDRDLGDATSYPGLSGRWVERGNCGVYYLNTGSAAQWWQFLRWMRSETFDLLYVNSLWAPAFSAVPLLAARLRVLKVSEVLIAPRGELSPGALSLKPTKKKVFLRAWRAILQNSNIKWHASANLEAEDIKAAFPGAKVIVNQDQSSLPEDPLPPSVVNPSRARLVFVSRVSPKKNLDIALRALRAVSLPLDFDIFGPIEDPNYWRECQRIINSLPSCVCVKYCGELQPSLVRETFAKYDSFLFPTRGENFGHVIAESLSASCPVICSDQTPWTDLLRSGGGTVVESPLESTLPAVLEKFSSSSCRARVAHRRQAGAAYRAWRDSVDRRNIIDIVRSAAGS
jgi:glycosyltransferase involved in cell wall biosynthesis